MPQGSRPSPSHPIHTSLLSFRALCATFAIAFGIGAGHGVRLRLRELGRLSDKTLLHHLWVIVQDPITFLPLSDRVSSVLSLNYWVWSDLYTEFLLLVPLEARILDTKWADAQLDRDLYQASRLLPPR